MDLGLNGRGRRVAGSMLRSRLNSVSGRWGDVDNFATTQHVQILVSRSLTSPVIRVLQRSFSDGMHSHKEDWRLRSTPSRFESLGVPE